MKRLVAVSEAGSIDAPADDESIIEHNGIALLLAPLRGDRHAEARLSYHRVVEIWRHSPVLPGGAGSLFVGGEQEAQDWLAAEQSNIAEALELVRGKGEFLATVSPIDGAAIGDAVGDGDYKSMEPNTYRQSGAAYLRQRANEINAAQRQVTALQQTAATLQSHFTQTLAGALTLQASSSNGTSIDVCVLIGADQWAAVSAATHTARLNNASLSLTGPWPPYTFAAALFDGATTAEAA